MVANAYNYFAILEAMNATAVYAITQLDIVSFFSMTKHIIATFKWLHKNAFLNCVL